MSSHVNKLEDQHRQEEHDEADDRTQRVGETEELGLDPVGQSGIELGDDQAWTSGRKYVAYTVKLPSEQLAALQTIWLELKRLYGTHSPDKSGMIQQAIAEWLKKWDGPERQQLLRELLEIRENTRKRQYRK